uniref:Dipeptidase n=1 Tax=Rhodnius prolixus TaxID=13249 RepID=T1HMZ0_RHOPR
MSFLHKFCQISTLEVADMRKSLTTPLNKKKALTFGGVIIVVIIIIIIIAVSVQRTSTPAEPKGSDVIKNHPFVLGGNSMSDLIKKNYRNLINGQDLDKLIAPGHATISELLQGKVAAQCTAGRGNCNAANIYVDINKAKNLKKLGSILRVDGGYTLDAKLSILRTYYNLGVRILAITGNCDNPWSKSVYNTNANHTNTTLEDFGKTIIKEMSRLGMIIDISGAIKATQLDILTAATTNNISVLLSRSGSKEVADNVNNVDKEVLAKLKQNGGLLMLSLDQKQVCGNTKNCTIHEVIVHLNKLRELLDVTNIGIGADFGDKDGKYPNDLDDPTKFGVLFDRLLTMNSLNGSKSWNAKDLKMLAGENFINLFKKVEEVAIKNAAEKPIEDLMAEDKFPKPVINATTTCYSDLDERYPKKI